MNASPMPAAAAIKVTMNNSTAVVFNDPGLLAAPCPSLAASVEDICLSHSRDRQNGFT
jgi:hypothetical protein